MKIGFIGSGNMAEALIKGLLDSKTFKKSEILTTDLVEDRVKGLVKKFGVIESKNNKDLVENSDVIVLAVKPKDIKHVLTEIKLKITKKKILISIAAGIKTSFIRSVLKKDLKLVRVMPNTPALVLEGASVIYGNENLDNTEIELIKRIFNSVGVAYLITSEELMDAVTGLSGSGPAFVSIFIEALSDGGVKMGLPRDMSLLLAAQTALGTSKMILNSKIKPSDLKDTVSSPGGTTIAGIHVLEKKGLRNAVISAVESATLRSKELASEED